MMNFRHYQDFLVQMPNVPMRLRGLGTNLALFLDSWAFSDMLEDLPGPKGGPISMLNSKLLETFNCLVEKLDNQKDPTGLSMLGYDSSLHLMDKLLTLKSSLMLLTRIHSNYICYIYIY